MATPEDEIIDRLRKLTSLDTPEDADWYDIGADIGLGFAPVAGTALSARDFERARRDDDWLGMGLSALGMIPIAGGVSRTVNMARKGGKAAKRRKTLNKIDAERAAGKVPDELGKFGDKARREAQTSRRVASQAGREVASTRRASGAGRRVRIDPDVYRQMQAAEGKDAVLDAARRGEHLRPNPGGGYVGAPRDVLDQRGINRTRDSLDAQVAEGARALEFADPGRVGTWYDRAQAGMRETLEPHQLPRGVEQHGVYSAGVSPESELAFALKHGNSRAIGEPQMAYRGAPMRKLDDAVAADQPANLTFKVGEYARKIDPREPLDSLFGVNDFRMAQSFGYTDPAGRPWKAGVSNTMHPFMDAETALAVDRANQNLVGGIDNWTGPKIQEVPWVYGKAQDLFMRGAGGRFSVDADGMVDALREANRTIADYFPKHALSVTHEYTPGKNTGHMSDLLDADFDTKVRYGEQGRWDTPYPGGGERRDSLYRAADLRQQAPITDAVGDYKNSAGDFEQNPLYMPRVLADFETGTPNQINPNTLNSVSAIERFRGAIDAQEAVAANLPVTTSGRTGQRNLLLDRGSGGVPNIAETNDLLRALDQVGPQHAGNMTATNRGAQVMVFPSEAASEAAAAAEKAGDAKRAAQILASDMQKQHRELMKAREQLEATMPGSTARKAANEGIYIDQVTSPEQFTGKTTEGVLQQYVDAPPEVARKVSESEEIRRIIGDKIDRDALREGGRLDIENMRRFFKDADWAKAVELMRGGMSAAAALAAMGYSITSMADEN